MNNFTEELKGNHSECVPNAEVVTKVLPTLYTFVFLVGLILNGLNLWIFCYIPSNRSFIVYLKNIVIADLLMTLTFPMKIISDAGFGNEHLRVFVCRFSAVVFYLNMYIGIIFLGILGFDRYFKIVRPMNSSTSLQNVFYSKVIAALVWALMAFISVPNMILTNQPYDTTVKVTCAKLKSELGLKWHTISNYICIAIFVLVFSLLLIFYVSISRKIFLSRQKFRRGSNAGRKSTRNIYSILIVFFICFVPYHLCRIPYTISQSENVFSCQYKKNLFYVKEVTLLLSAANVCLDPVIYFFMCQPFRQMLFKKMGIEDRHQETEKASCYGFPEVTYEKSMVRSAQISYTL
ncbi:P2Y purinoceptor 14 [Hyla sarda]|uniref:P2Y purinoceptor 14 n=1 Tax=Hyla sarda TaxID=327740 RepID=UPI0024C46C4B|nr:P2Y purinoceptor 14 [Hyla sarda]XP_056420930.1 P2Y purinoceptor 14 [Hyla sarda]XP_056420931.1 P2Y purinoceptor 14 [Hyla sarda]XP_056420932.1 P2Y purinoceptor 14 [Hyla sarda]XP_056420933.1 P2Y purinoceptor 14 [Hyla sarda]XP_056420934.1 P2Y purinoceptor 14 [Hyla sarda]XP_056420935.1 P2Y purinoceptor 14 [Hyla sarda]XP_056420936.1 P2Y purinoceptor 14 [Hyla sarda]